MPMIVVGAVAVRDEVRVTVGVRVGVRDGVADGVRVMVGVLVAVGVLAPDANTSIARDDVAPLDCPVATIV